MWLAGNWVVGCTKRLGVMSNFVVGLCGMHNGLQLILNKNLLLFYVKLDSFPMVNLINNKGGTNMYIGAMI